METAVILVPILWTENSKELAEALRPREQKAKLDSFLADGYQIKIMQEFEYEHIHFTHYVLVKDESHEEVT